MDDFNSTFEGDSPFGYGASTGNDGQSEIDSPITLGQHGQRYLQTLEYTGDPVAGIAPAKQALFDAQPGPHAGMLKVGLSTLLSAGAPGQDDQNQPQSATTGEQPSTGPSQQSGQDAQQGTAPPKTMNQAMDDFQASTNANKAQAQQILDNMHSDQVQDAARQAEQAKADLEKYKKEAAEKEKGGANQTMNQLTSGLAGITAALGLADLLKNAHPALRYLPPVAGIFVKEGVQNALQGAQQQPQQRAIDPRYPESPDNIDY